MDREETVPLTARDRWNEQLGGIRHGFAHTWASCHSMHLSTGYATYLYSLEVDGVRVVCPIAERPFGAHTDIVTPYGVSGFVGTGPCPAFASHWARFAAGRGYVCGFISVHPVFEQPSYYPRESVERYNTIYVLDLTPSHADLLARMSANRRKQLQQTAPTFVFDRALLTEFVLANYQDFMRRKAASAVYDLSVETLTALTALDNALLIGASGPGGAVEAVSLFAYTPHAATYLFNVSLPEGRTHAAPLIWRAVTELKSLGVPYLDLGGGIRENDGVAEFKRRFGSREMPLQALKQVYRPEVFADLCRQMNVRADAPGYFPPYRRA